MRGFSRRAFYGDTLLCKQCICSHKYSKRASGVTAGNPFLLAGGSAPKPLFRRLPSAAAHRSGAFLSSPRRDFGNLETYKSSRNDSGHESGSQSRSQPRHGAVPRGWGASQQAKTAVSGIVRSRRLEPLYIQRHCLRISALPSFLPAPDKNFSAGIDRNVRLCYHCKELNTAHIFYADT